MNSANCELQLHRHARGGGHNITEQVGQLGRLYAAISGLPFRCERRTSQQSSGRLGEGAGFGASKQLPHFISPPPFAVGLSSSMSDLLLHNGGNCLSPFDLRWPLERGHLVSAVCACKHRQSPVFNSFLVRRQIGSWTHATKKSRQTRSSSVMSVAK